MDLDKYGKFIFGMVHMDPLPGSYNYNRDGGFEKIINDAKRDAEILADSGFDGFVFSNEGDRPYDTPMPKHTVASMTRVIREVATDYDLAFGLSVLSDAEATLSVGQAVGASFIRTFITYSYVTDWGIISPNPREIRSLQRQLGAEDIEIFANLTGHSAFLADRDIVDLVGGANFVAQVEVVCLAGASAGTPVNLEQMKKVKDEMPEIKVVAGTGVNHNNVEQMLEVADGAIVGTSLKEGGNTFNPVDEDRAKKFMDKVNTIR